MTTKTSSKSSKTSLRVSKYTIIGIIITLFNFISYTILAQTVFSGQNNLLWLASLISTSITSVVAYLLHSKITWKERHPGKTGIIRFFIWNVLLSVAVCPFFTLVFGFITPLYQSIYNIFSAIHLPLNYDFVESTAIFCLVSVVVIIMNYFFYGRLVFGEQKSTKKSTKNHRTIRRSK